MKNKLIIFIISVIFGSLINPGILVSAEDLEAAQVKEQINVAVNIEDTESETPKTTEVKSEDTSVSTPETKPQAKSETKPAPKAKPVSETKTVSETKSASEPKTTPEPAKKAVVTTPVYTEPENNIKITGKTLEVVPVSSTTVDAGKHVNKFGDKFLYGHNSSTVFGGLKNLKEGNTFTVTINGTTTTYRIAKMVIFEKNASNGRLQLDGNGSYMNLVAAAKHQGVQYDLSIMTCHGTLYGNGDASHRLVIFANAI